MEFFRKKQKVPQEPYDRTKKYPVIRASICNGEKVAGFRDIATGRFEEVMFLRTEKDKQKFMEWYGVEEQEIKKEW